MLGGKFEFEGDLYGGKELGALTKSDVERLLTMEETTVEVRSGEGGGLIFPRLGGNKVEVVNPRCRVMERNLDPDDDFLEARFGVVLSVPSEKFVPKISTEEGGSGGRNPTLRDEEPRSVEDVIEDDTEDTDDGVETEEKHILTDEGDIEVREVPVDANDDEQSTNDDNDNQ